MYSGSYGIAAQNERGHTPQTPPLKRYRIVVVARGGGLFTIFMKLRLLSLYFVVYASAPDFLSRLDSVNDQIIRAHRVLISAN